MYIKEATEEIVRTVRAYTKKDEKGELEIPVLHQRPVFLVGPPGIGKTAIIEQAARICNVGVVSYTITHHTRQSAIGLPIVSHKSYGGKQYQITEYTMSEIIASLYNYMEETGFKTGILFIDEINCVSETLAPTMLQFLQYKTFGTHKVPDGWIIVAAGNPPEYNKSVKEFDIATLDRIRKIEIKEDFHVWKEYALSHGICGSIISYLSIKNEHFYHIENDIENLSFVTARGWEDLSKMILTYKKLGFEIGRDLVAQFINDDEIAKDFTAYLELYDKYESDYQVKVILEEGASEKLISRIQKASFDERLSVVELLTYRLIKEAKSVRKNNQLMRNVFSYLKSIKSQNLSVKELEEALKKRKEILKEESYTPFYDWMEAKVFLLKKKDTKEVFQELKQEFETLKQEDDKNIHRMQEFLNRAFDFIKKGIGNGQEMVIFISDLGNNEDSVWYLSSYGNEDFFEYSKQFQFKERERKLQSEILKLQQTFMQ